MVYGTKPNEIRHSQVSCELENYVLQRGQSLSYSADMNSEEVLQLTDRHAVEVVDSDPSVSVSLDINEFGSIYLYNILSGNYTGFPDGTININELQSVPVDLLVSVKEEKTETVSNRALWFNHCFLDSYSATYTVDGFCTESISLSGNSARWFKENAPSSTHGACKLLNFTYVNDRTMTISPDFDEPSTELGIHAFTENGLSVPLSNIHFDAATHDITALNEFVFGEEHRYRAVSYGRPDFPYPNSSASPIGGIVGREVEVFLWDTSQTNFSPKTDIGVNTPEQLLRVQSVDYEVSFDREELKQAMTGLYSKSYNTKTITATMSLVDSDLELWARCSGNSLDYTAGDVTSIMLEHLSNVKALSLKIDIFNSKSYEEHTPDNLLKQIIFSGGKVTSISDSRDTPGRGTQSVELQFISMEIIGTGAVGRQSVNLWNGKDFAFVFITDDNINHNLGWAEVCATKNCNFTMAANTHSASNAIPSFYNYRLTKDEFTQVVDIFGTDLASHSFTHGKAGKFGWYEDGLPNPEFGGTDTSEPQNFSGSLVGYFETAYTFPNGIIDSSYYFLNEIDRATVTTALGSGGNKPVASDYDSIRCFAYPQNQMNHETMSSLERSGYWGARGGVFAGKTLAFPNTPINTKDNLSIMRVPTAASDFQITGGTSTDATVDIVLSESQIRQNVSNMINGIPNMIVNSSGDIEYNGTWNGTGFKSGGTQEGGICVLFTHSFGEDGADAYPNGYYDEYNLVRNITYVPWYPQGIRKDELGWIIDEIRNQNGKVLTFKEALGQFRSKAHRVEDVVTDYGQDYTGDIIWTSGNADPDGPPEFIVPSVISSSISYRVSAGRTVECRLQVETSGDCVITTAISADPNKMFGVGIENQGAPDPDYIVTARPDTSSQVWTGSATSMYDSGYIDTLTPYDTMVSIANIFGSELVLYSEYRLSTGVGDYGVWPMSKWYTERQLMPTNL